MSILGFSMFLKWHFSSFVRLRGSFGTIRTWIAMQLPVDSVGISFCPRISISKFHVRTPCHDRAIRALCQQRPCLEAQPHRKQQASALPAQRRVPLFAGRPVISGENEFNCFGIDCVTTVWVVGSRKIGNV